MNEDEFLRLVLDLAGVKGWLRMHQRPALCRTGRWSTATQGDGKGWPDLVIEGAARQSFAQRQNLRRPDVDPD